MKETIGNTFVIKLVIVLKILLGEENIKVLIICNLLKISQIKKKIIIIDN